MSQLRSADMVLIGARPGRGKALFGLELAALAEKSNRKSYVFSLEYNEAHVWERFARLGFDRDAGPLATVLGTSDDTPS